LRRVWNSTPAEPSKAELKAIHKLIKKVTRDIENFSFNTSVSAFMIAVSELSALKSANREVMNLFTRVIAPFAPHIAEEFWHRLGESGSVVDAEWPAFNEQYLVEDTVKYPVSFNGKARFTIELPAGTSKEDVEKAALSDAAAERWLDGKTPKKVIVVPGRIVNIVI